MKALRTLPIVIAGLVALPVGSVFAEGSLRFALYSSIDANTHNNNVGAFSSFGSGRRAPTLENLRAAALPKLTVAFTLTAEGQPTAIRLLKSSGDPKLDTECLATLNQTRLDPKRVNGVAVSSEETYVITPTRSR